jgi:enamine deaminase RidA (YjgF/YER057c/UK114 family)
VVADLVLPEAVVEISMIAVPPGTSRRAVLPAGWAAPTSPYSYGVLAGDSLFLAGLLARNPRDNSVISGDMKVQTRAAMESAGEILKAAGMDYVDVVSSRVFITDTAMFQDMNAAYRTFFPADPPARATVRTGLTGPDYKVEVTLTAVKGPQRQAFTTPNADGSPGTKNPNLSGAIRSGSRLYVSGMLGNTESNKGDTLLQTRETLTRIGRTLRVAGFDWSDVADGIVYLTDVKNFAAMNQAYREIFAKDFPARATVQTGLVAPDGLVEIMFVAAK